MFDVLTNPRLQESYHKQSEGLTQQVTVKYLHKVPRSVQMSGSLEKGLSIVEPLEKTREKLKPMPSKPSSNNSHRCLMNSEP